MRFGLLADIHEDSQMLREAIQALRERGIDRFIMLGDVFETGTRLAETVDLLIAADIRGVWGNHDFGLCRNPCDQLRDRYGEVILAYFSSLSPTFEQDDVYFSHVEPWKNAEEIMDLWSFEPEETDRSFQDRSHRLMVHGHHHRWKVCTPDGPCQWDCFRPLDLDPSRRYLISVGAVVDGRCGILDTTSNQLIPIDLRDGNETEPGR